MISIKKFVFSPFSENTYILYNENGDAVIIDPGCFTRQEENELSQFIESKNLTVKRLLNTHGHIDHIFGNKYVCEKYNLHVEIHEKDLVTLKRMPFAAELWGIKGFQESPEPGAFLEEGNQIFIGSDKLIVEFVPGHSPGHVAFICHAQKFIIGGDVLFEGSIGRVDMPGGSLEILMQSIQQKFMTLDDDFIIYNGHGNNTTVGKERMTNPFILEYL